jgi:hypothetical protein
LSQFAGIIAALNLKFSAPRHKSAIIGRGWRMTFLMTLIYWETYLLLFGLLGLAATLLLTGQINTDGLLYGKKGDGTTYLSPERIQLLLFTLAAAFQYLETVLRDPTSFPSVPGGWIAVLGGSHAVYLSGKLGASFVGKSPKLQ